ncbi:hypothetical protein B0T17DRAFT_506821 [Bombardia bombarda]|uniref:Uncharacterized protein n=1 Tax=Bombardia bombarda TaxID=252184 RepID=A0AA39XAI1_9PEZI|nr:hypothetical protein B0T17DRAFT_506821 [Bombardia bombarda]
MRRLTRLSSCVTLPRPVGALRAMTNSASQTPFRPTTVDILHIWEDPSKHQPFSILPNEQSSGYAPDRRAREQVDPKWSDWHIPDVSIKERADRRRLFFSRTLTRFQSLHVRGANGDICHGPFGGGWQAITIGGEVKGNPTESEEDVAADRTEFDPLPPEKHKTIRMPAGEAAPKPTDSEERVKADREREDPLRKRRGDRDSMA